MTAQRVGFIGLGAMGGHMAAHLARAGFLRAVSNRSAAKAEAFVAEHGGEVVALADPTELARQCEVVVSCVTADADVLELARRCAAAARPGLLLIDTSTIASTSAKEAAEILRAAGGDFVDAPVSGGVEGARNGKLSVMAGGSEAAMDLAQPVLACFAGRITHMGPVGAGQNTKAVNQVLVAGIAEAVCEGLALGEALGLPADKLLPTLEAGAANAWFLQKRGATMLRDEFSVGFKLALLHKDLNIVRQLATDVGSAHVIIDRALSDYAELMARGHGDDDISGLIRLKRP